MTFDDIFSKYEDLYSDEYIAKNIIGTNAIKEYLKEKYDVDLKETIMGVDITGDFELDYDYGNFSSLIIKVLYRKFHRQGIPWYVDVRGVFDIYIEGRIIKWVMRIESLSSVIKKSDVIWNIEYLKESMRDLKEEIKGHTYEESVRKLMLLYLENRFLRLKNYMYKSKFDMRIEKIADVLLEELL